MKLLSFSHLFWRSISLIFFSFFLLPVIFVLASLFTDYNDNWSHLINFVLTDYILNSIYLLLAFPYFSSIWCWYGLLVTTMTFRQRMAGVGPHSSFGSASIYSCVYLYKPFDSYGSANEIMRYIFSVKMRKLSSKCKKSLWSHSSFFINRIHMFISRHAWHF